jgi:hypothetical protein
MKKQTNTIALAIVLTAFLAASSAQAQTASTSGLTATIPFAFSVKGKTFPAGEYTISCVNPDSPNRVLRLRRNDGGAELMLQTASIVGEIRDDGRLVFRRYGNLYFLAEAWMPADDTGLKIAKSRSEKELSRPLSLKAATETVALNSRQR